VLRWLSLPGSGPVVGVAYRPRSVWFSLPLWPYGTNPAAANTPIRARLGSNPPAPHQLSPGQNHRAAQKGSTYTKPPSYAFKPPQLAWTAPVHLRPSSRSNSASLPSRPSGRLPSSAGISTIPARLPVDIEEPPLPSSSSLTGAFTISNTALPLVLFSRKEAAAATGQLQTIDLRLCLYGDQAQVPLIPLTLSGPMKLLPIRRLRAAPAALRRFVGDPSPRPPQPPRRDALTQRSTIHLCHLRRYRIGTRSRKQVNCDGANDVPSIKIWIRGPTPKVRRSAPYTLLPAFPEAELDCRMRGLSSRRGRNDGRGRHGGTDEGGTISRSAAHAASGKAGSRV